MESTDERISPDSTVSKAAKSFTPVPKKNAGLPSLRHIRRGDSAQEEWGELSCRVQQSADGTWNWMLLGEGHYPSIKSPYTYATLQQAKDDIRTFFGSVFVEVIQG
jgi:hypothetical protein